ncbi:MAG: hypothetical protein WKG32_06225 [Gemmatimonadaceae bacterium]
MPSQQSSALGCHVLRIREGLVLSLVWLGDARGHLIDWLTQRWVQFTGRRVDLARDAWLDGPVGDPGGIGADFFDRLASVRGLRVRRGDPDAGLMPAFGSLAGPAFDPGAVDPRVAAFYERTAGFDLDAWAEWCGLFRPFGQLLAWLFSRRLQQLNVPLTGLDTSRGMTSEVIQLVDPATGGVRLTAWVRRLLGTGRVLYAGSYSVCQVPGFAGPCVRVVFPLPNGNAMVVMRPVAHEDGSFSVVSAGRSFGEPGFYFTVHGREAVWARYLQALRETIRVYAAEDGGVRADHVLTLWGATFLRLHYRLRAGRAVIAAPAT